MDGTVEDLIEWIASPTGGGHHTKVFEGAEIERIPGVLHFIGNIHYEFAFADLALVHSYCMTLQVEHHDDGSHDFLNIGLRYVDGSRSATASGRSPSASCPRVRHAARPVRRRRAAEHPVPPRRYRTDEYWKMRAEIGLSRRVRSRSRTGCGARRGRGGRAVRARSPSAWSCTAGSASIRGAATSSAIRACSTRWATTASSEGPGRP